MNQDLESETEGKSALEEEEEEIVGDLNDELKYEFDFEPGEEFKVVAGFPNYVISNHGRLYDLELSKFVNVKLRYEAMPGLLQQLDTAKWQSEPENNEVKVAVKDEVSPANPKVELCSFSVNFRSFLDTIPNEEIDVKELTRLYNDFFNKSISTISFGKLKEVKNHFTKREVKRCGKFVKLYQKV